MIHIVSKAEKYLKNQGAKAIKGAKTVIQDLKLKIQKAVKRKELFSLIV